MSEVRARVSGEEQLALYCMALGYAMLFGNYPLPQAVLGLEQEKTKKGSGGQRKPKAAVAADFDPASEPLPPVLDTAEFREAWAHRLEERAEWSVRAPSKRERTVATLTPRQVRGHLRDLAKVAELKGVAAAVRCCNRAENGHWQGVVYERDLEFEAKYPVLSREPARPAPGSTAAQLERAARIDEQEAPSIWR